MTLRKIALTLCLVGATVATMLFAGWIITPDQPRRTTSSSTPSEITAVPVDIGGPFELVSHKGEVATDANFRGRHLLIFFGYTFCPDICPTTLQQISLALDKLGPLAAEIQPLFISVDPQRDTPENLAAYVASFHPSILGLTGTPEQIAAVAKPYRAYYRKVEETPSDESYLVDHSAYIYLMGPDGAYRTMFSHQTTPEQLAEGIRAYLEPS